MRMKISVICAGTARSREGGGRGVLMALDALTMETTGSFVHGNYGEGLKPCPW